MRYIVKGYCPLTGKDMHLVCNSRQTSIKNERRIK